MRKGGMDGYFEDLTLESARGAGLRIHKFKRHTELPRVARILGMLRPIRPEATFATES